MEEDKDTKDVDTNPGSAKEVKSKVFLPGQPMEVDEELVHDPSAYVMLHNAKTVAPCLSFDIIRDDLGNTRDQYPLSMYLVSGTQAENRRNNRVIVMKFSNLNKTQKLKSDSDSEDESDSEDDSDDEEEKGKLKPKMDFIQIRHDGCVNRIKTTSYGGRTLASVWSETGRVSIIDLDKHLGALDSPTSISSMKNKLASKEHWKPLYVFSGHLTEGFALDWSPTAEGVLASGDCRKHIHIWKPHESSWNVDQRPLIGHKNSVEDLQWSPNEANVLASCSVDKSIRIWDVRDSPSTANKLTVENAHEHDVNVISWNRNEPFIVSGGDDGFLQVWDIRVFQKGKSVAKLKHHLAPVCTVEWHPSDASVFASGGEDNQIAIWDLEAERDADAVVEDDVKHLPPQLLFIHQGQEEIKELHWHRQIPGVLVSTASSGINIFRTISI